MVSANRSSAVPPGTALVAMALSTEGPLQKILFKLAANLPDIFEPKVCVQGLRCFFGFPQHFADEIVRLAERTPRINKVIGRIGWQEERDSRPRRTAGLRETSLRSARLVRPSSCLHLIVRGKKRLFAPAVALITGGQAFQRGEQTEKCRGDAASLAAQKFPRRRDFSSGASSCCRWNIRRAK